MCARRRRHPPPPAFRPPPTLPRNRDPCTTDVHAQSLGAMGWVNGGGERAHTSTLFPGSKSRVEISSSCQSMPCPVARIPDDTHRAVARALLEGDSAPVMQPDAESGRAFMRRSPTIFVEKLLTFWTSVSTKVMKAISSGCCFIRTTSTTRRTLPFSVTSWVIDLSLSRSR